MRFLLFLLYEHEFKALDQELFCLDLGTPDRLSAELVKKQFILNGNEIYQMLITKLTEETLYRSRSRKFPLFPS